MRKLLEVAILVIVVTINPTVGFGIISAGGVLALSPISTTNPPAEKVNGKEEFIRQTKAFAKEMMPKIEALGAMLYDLDQGLKRAETKREIQETLDRARQSLDELVTPFEPFRNKISQQEFDGISSVVKTLSIENYSHPLQLIMASI